MLVRAPTSFLHCAGRSLDDPREPQVASAGERGSPSPKPRLHAAPGRAAALALRLANELDRVPAAGTCNDAFPGEGGRRAVRSVPGQCALLAPGRRSGRPLEPQAADVDRVRRIRGGQRRRGVRGRSRGRCPRSRAGPTIAGRGGRPDRPPGGHERRRASDRRGALRARPSAPLRRGLGLLRVFDSLAARHADSVQERREPAPSSLRSRLAEGFRFLWSNPFLRAWAFLFGPTNFFGPGLMLALVVIGTRQGLSGGEVGVLVAAFSACVLLGSSSRRLSAASCRSGQSCCSSSGRGSAARRS
jgi:hypothetical protein